jgi:predicted restriction endonuclease
LLLQCEFDTKNRIQNKGVIGQSLQTIRSLSSGDTKLLVEWSKKLRPEPRAYEIADEAALEKSFESGEDALRETVLEHHSGVSERRRLLLQRSYRRNRTLVTELHELYAGRCQLCGFDPPLLYCVSACCGHHVNYLSRGGRDEQGNLMLVCPNHHEVIHATNAVFDFKDLHYVFPNGRREPLVLNKHFARAT